MRNKSCYPLKWIFLYRSPFSYRSSNFAIAKVVALNLFASNICCSFTLLEALAKSNGNLFAIAFKSDSFKGERHQKRSKELIPKRLQRGLRVITLQGFIKKSPVLRKQYWKNESLDDTIIISYFGGSNNIFADCTYILGKDSNLKLYQHKMFYPHRLK